MRIPGIEEKVEFLRRPENYPAPTGRVDSKETHMSWVFLTDRHAYKLKKPVRYAFLDYSTLEARRRTCEVEVRLNRRLAGEVYCGITPLTLSDVGELRLGGTGEVVDWLVKMRRLPECLMLDHVIAAQTVNKTDVHRVGVVLAGFYRSAWPVPMTGADYRRRLTEEIHSNSNELKRPEFQLSTESIDALAATLLKFLSQRPEMFDRRIREERIVEAHGDLRPEHICLGPQPVIIDCLEFNRSLRILDAASEIAFLWLECERLGAADAGRMIFETYRDTSGDWPPAHLMGFYKSFHAYTRAKIAVWHLDDIETNNPAKWIERANCYLRLAASNMMRGIASSSSARRQISRIS